MKKGPANAGPFSLIPQPLENPMTIQVSMTALVITRDAMTILPRDVPTHEVEIAKAVFGEDNVEVIGLVEGQSVELDASLEHERLAQKYGPDAVQAAYGTNYKGATEKACKAAEFVPAKGKAKAEA